MKRTVIRTSSGTGLDTKGTAAGFRQALSKLPADQPVLIKIERNSQPNDAGPTPEFRVSAILIASGDEILLERYGR
jgi:hypothetical protein